MGRGVGWRLFCPAFVATLLVVYVMAVFGRPPPSVQAMAITGLIGGWLSIAWAYGIDQHRKAVSS